MKLSNFLIGMMLISLTAVVVTNLFANIVTNTSVTFDNTTFIDYDKFGELQNQTVEINSTLKNIRQNEQGGVISFASAFIGSGWKLVKTTFTSFDIFTDLVATTGSKLGLSDNAGAFVAAFFFIVFVLFIFAVAGILLGRDV